jgi:acid phosphatase (class A)
MMEDVKKSIAVCCGFLILFGVTGCRMETSQDHIHPQGHTVIDPFDYLSGAASSPYDSLREALIFEEKDWAPEPVAILKNKKPVYLVDWKGRLHLPKYPCNTSERTRAELDYLLDLQEKRSPEELKLIQDELEYDQLYIGRSFGSGFNRKDLPLTLLLLQRVYQDVAIVVLNFKKEQPRTRPSVLDSRIHPAIPMPAWPAYPSGHATVAFSYAFVLQELMPTKREALLKEAFAIGRHREVAGVHFPSDTSAAKLVARQVVDLLCEQPKFREDFEKSRKELEAAGFK